MEAIVRLSRYSGVLTTIEAMRAFKPGHRQQTSPERAALATPGNLCAKRTELSREGHL